VLDDYWQRLVQAPDKETGIFRVEVGLGGQAEKESAVQEYLKSGFLIQSDAPQMRRRAEAITTGVKTDREKAVKVSRWVYRHMDRSSLRMSMPSALEVLQTLKGDCNEHAALFAALARAAGVPTKVWEVWKRKSWRKLKGKRWGRPIRPWGFE